MRCSPALLHLEGVVGEAFKMRKEASAQYTVKHGALSAGSLPSRCLPYRQRARRRPARPPPQTAQ